MTQPTFERWMASVNAKLLELCGLDSSDLPDIDYAGAWEAGMTPGQAARRAISNAME